LTRPESGRNDDVPGEWVPGEWVEIAYVQTTHGRHGELAADLLTDFPERFQPGLAVSLLGAAGRRTYRVEEAWFHKGRVILKLEGVDTLTAAEPLRGASVQIPRAARVALPPDRVYVSDLIGCEVIEGDRAVGVVSGWQETGAVALLRVQRAAGPGAGGGSGSGGGDEILIPFTPAICHTVDVEKRIIRVSLPEGLLDLNSPSKPRSKD
jgi:16S rRNA processing protein RimM